MAAPKPAPRPERRSWFELVRTDAGWHCRLVGTNGEIVMASEVHPDRRDAESVLALCRGALPRNGYVDERTAAADAQTTASGGDSVPASDDEAGAGTDEGQPT
jgi:uncharacterized protein YegP (UPF0339 family)